VRKKIIIAFTSLIIIGSFGYYAYTNRPRPPVETKFVQNIGKEETSKQKEGSSNIDPSSTNVNLKEPGNYALLDNPNHVYQTFNNCGPATLSMILSWYGIDVDQQELGNKMRPYQNPQGDNDDKTIFTYEFVDWAKKYDLEAIGLVNGDIELLKKFTANGIPVVVKTWLNPGEDIGHFRIVRGFNEDKKVIIQDDSYQGPNKEIAYFDFLGMWQPFNYNYMIIYTPAQKDIIKAIVKEEINSQTAWENALERAKLEKQKDPESPYPSFNISTAAYHLRDYQRSVDEFEKVQNKLPKRMLWYQIEPILAYKELGNYDKVFTITENILENGNRAFSELYLIRGDIYLEQGNLEAAKDQYEKAVFYNKNLVEAKEKLESL
jgi:tetratricopeptide (TPR) repeat protein